ncbi:MAG TPA: tRNA (adenosine(37)-N6)-threonylcarbamoyltransferase complex ATPase subunit type 1 TsaE [Streptosporangiaceae bacterium]|nr:tRNA (adenosine(37)-N6)-threonylcarbamoyltransferase complex ATPase subunit type 1 TsaE [Streptosporangiaceae bacterium]
MDEPQVLVPGAAQMRELGRRLAGLLRAGDLVVLTGPLGAGKTTLVQGIGAGLFVRGPVTSPTFVIARVHPSLSGGPDLVHADAYRLGSRLEVDDLDLDADLDHSVTIVEWGEGLVEPLGDGYLSITISMRGAAAADGGEDGGEDGDEPRLVAVAGHGDRWQEMAAELHQLMGKRPLKRGRPGGRPGK